MTDTVGQRQAEHDHVARTKPEHSTRADRFDVIAHALGFRFRLHHRELPGCPDVVFPRYRAVTMVHGCFWHRHAGCKLASRPSTRVEYWEQKFTKTVDQDRRNQTPLRILGWRVLAIWECETKDHSRLAERIASFLRKEPQNNPGMRA